MTTRERDQLKQRVITQLRMLSVGAVTYVSYKEKQK